MTRKFSSFLVIAVVTTLLACSNEVHETQSQVASETPENPEGPNEELDEPIPEEPTPRLLGSSLFIGDSLSSDTRFAHTMVDFLDNPESHCEAFRENSLNQSYSYARPSAAVRHYAEMGSNKDWLCQQKTIYRNGTGKNLTGSELCAGTLGKTIFENLLAGHKPQTLIIALGTNSLGFSASYIEAETTKMLQSIDTSKVCYWILPTYVSSKYRDRIIKTRNAIKNAIKNSSSSCTPIDTFEAMRVQTHCSSFYVSDGIHHTNCGSGIWAEEAIKQICVLNSPTE